MTYTPWPSTRCLIWAVVLSLPMWAVLVASMAWWLL